MSLSLIFVISTASSHRCQILSNWQKQFFENGAAAFEQTRSAPEKHQERRIAALQDKLQRKNEVVAELLEEHVKLKKVLGEL